MPGSSPAAVFTRTPTKRTAPVTVSSTRNDARPAARASTTSLSPTMLAVAMERLLDATVKFVAVAPTADRAKLRVPWSSVIWRAWPVASISAMRIVLAPATVLTSVLLTLSPAALPTTA